MSYNEDKFSASEIADARAILRSVAFKPRKYADGLITYGQLVDELATKGHREFRDGHDARLHSLLGKVGCADFRSGDGALCAVVVTKATKMPGAGFFRLVNEAFYPGESRDPLQVWTDQVKFLHDRYAKSPH